MVWWATLALGAPLTAEQLLELPAHCALDDTWAYERAAGRGALLQYGGLAGIEGIQLDVKRRVLDAPSRADREHAPWRWKEQIRIEMRDGVVISGAPQVLEGTFDCVDLSDPASIWVDLSRYFGPELPAPGVTRCRDDSGWAFVSVGYFGGIIPSPGTTLLTQLLVKDGLEVASEVQRKSEPATGDLDVEWGPPTPLPSSVPDLQRIRQALIFRHRDGTPLLGEPSLRRTLVCESGLYPPAP